MGGGRDVFGKCCRFITARATWDVLLAPRKRPSHYISLEQHPTLEQIVIGVLLRVVDLPRVLEALDLVEQKLGLVNRLLELLIGLTVRDCG